MKLKEYIKRLKYTERTIRGKYMYYKYENESGSYYEGQKDLIKEIIKDLEDLEMGGTR